MKVNNLIKILTFSDVLILSGWGLINPIFAVFVTKQIEGGTLELIGFATSIYWILRSGLQLPFARLIDSRKGEIDDFVLMFIGSVLMVAVPFLYFLFASKPIHVLFLQGMLGLSSAMVSPSWLAIFTRHIDSHIEAEEWGLYNSMVGIGVAGAGALGGFMGEKFGIRILYLLVGIISLFGVSFLFFVYQDLRKQERTARRFVSLNK